MFQAEERGLPFLFKLRQTEGVLRHLAKLSKRRDWEFAGGGWRGVESELQLPGWPRKRRVVILRRARTRRNSSGGIGIDDGAAGADRDGGDE